MSFISSCGVTTKRGNYLLLLQDKVPLWSRNGWVRATFKLLNSTFLDIIIDGIFGSAINAPTTGGAYGVYLAAAKALGSR